MAISLLELRTQSRQMADMSDSTFVTNSELNNYINFAIAELHDLLVDTYGSDYFLSSVIGNTVANQTDYALPEDFYKVRGVDIQINNSNWSSVDNFNFNERNRSSDFGERALSGVINIRYRVMGGFLKFTPIPVENATYRLWYIPKATKLVADEDTFDDINQYSDFVIITAAMKMLHKEETDVTRLAEERNRIIKRIEVTASNRDAGKPETISDVYAEYDYYYLYTTRG